MHCMMTKIQTDRQLQLHRASNAVPGDDDNHDYHRADTEHTGQAKHTKRQWHKGRKHGCGK